MRPVPASKGDTARGYLSAIQYRNATDGTFTIRISERKSNCKKQWVCSRYRSIAFFCMEAAIRGCSGPAGNAPNNRQQDSGMELQQDKARDRQGKCIRMA